jgi:hypothetical protein
MRSPTQNESYACWRPLRRIEIEPLVIGDRKPGDLTLPFTLCDRSST